MIVRLAGWAAQLLAAVACFVLLAAATTSATSAHAGLDESDPQPNAVLPQAPQVVTMRFTEPLEWSYTTAELYDQSGEVVAGTSVREGADEHEMLLELPPGLANGTYSVLWRTLSTADGHTAQNYFAFTVGSEADVTTAAGPAEGSGESGPPLWLRSASRWIALLGLSAAVAIWPIWLFVARPAASPGWRHARRITELMRDYAVIAILVALAGDIVALAVQAASLDGGTFLDKVRGTLGNTRYGELWFLRVTLLLAYALTLQWVAWWWPRRRPVPAIAALALSAALVIPFSYIAHASAQTTGRGAAILNDVLHLYAASLWSGGLMAIAIVLLPAIRPLPNRDRRLVLARALPRFSTVAIIAWITMAITGSYNAWLQVGSIDALLDTDYGNTLLVKLGLLVPILLLAAFNLLVVTSRLERHVDSAASWARRFTLAVGAEVALTVIVLLVVGALTAQAPARESLAADTAPVQVELTGGEQDATLTVAPGTPGPNRFEIAIGGDPLSHETAVLLRIQSEDQDTGEQELALQHAETNTYSYQGSELSIAGSWSFELIVRPPNAVEWRAFGSAALAAGAPDSAASAPSWVFGTVGGIAGLLLTLVGAGVMVAFWRAARPRSRPGLLALGAAAVIIGVVMFALSRQEVSREIARAVTGLG